MLYQALEPKVECFDKCTRITGLILLTTTSVFTMLTFLYMKGLVEGLEDANLKEVEQIFEQFRECVIESGICRK